MLLRGSVAERPNALALKARDLRGSGGSNPSASAAVHRGTTPGASMLWIRRSCPSIRRTPACPDCSSRAHIQAAARTRSQGVPGDAHGVGQSPDHGGGSRHGAQTQRIGPWTGHQPGLFRHRARLLRHLLRYQDARLVRSAHQCHGIQRTGRCLKFRRQELASDAGLQRIRYSAR